MNNKPWRRLQASIFLLAAATAMPALALDPFYLNVNVSSTTGAIGHYEQGYSKLEDAINQLDFNQLRQHTPAYANGNEAVNVGFYLRGLTVTMLFPDDTLSQSTTSSVLTFRVPNAQIDTQFTGTGASIPEARADAIRQLKDYLKKNKPALRRLLNAFARYSPIDPLAGNPDSLFGQRMKNDFSHGFTNKVSQIWGCSTSAFNFSNDAPIQVASNGGTGDIFADAQARQNALQAQNEVGIGLMASSTQAKVDPSGGAPGGTFATMSLTLPFSYTAKLDSDPRKKIRVDLPLTYSDSEGASSYSLGLGLAYTHPLTDEWSLTPAVGVGAAGSQDLGSAGGVGSYSLTSAYTWRFDAVALSMGNSIGQYQSLGFKIGDVEAEADIKNTVFTNGFLLTGPNSLISKNLVVEYSLIDTRITGDEVYTDSSDEIGVALGHISTDQGVIDSYTKLGLSYLMAKGVGDINSIRLTLTSRF